MKEVDRLGVIKEVAGSGCGSGVRRYREEGARGLISGHRGRKANNAIAPEVRAEIIALR